MLPAGQRRSRRPLLTLLSCSSCWLQLPSMRRIAAACSVDGSQPAPRSLCHCSKGNSELYLRSPVTEVLDQDRSMCKGPSRCPLSAFIPDVGPGAVGPRCCNLQWLGVAGAGWRRAPSRPWSSRLSSLPALDSFASGVGFSRGCRRGRGGRAGDGRDVEGAGPGEQGAGAGGLLGALVRPLPHDRAAHRRDRAGVRQQDRRGASSQCCRSYAGFGILSAHILAASPECATASLVDLRTHDWMHCLVLPPPMPRFYILSREQKVDKLCLLLSHSAG